MKIVHIITRLILGGAQENTLITCMEQAKRGHDVTLITGPALGPEGGLFKSTKNQAFKTIVIDKMVREINPLWDYQVYQQLKIILAEIDADIIHTHSAKAGIIGRLAGFSLKQNNGAIKPAIVHTIHGLAFHDYQHPLVNKLYIEIEKYTSKKTDAIIGVADVMRDKALAAGMGNAEMYTTAYSAINEDEFLEIPSESQITTFRKKYDLAENATVIVCVARLAELKGHNYIIESAEKLAEKHPNLMWLFVGNGSLTAQIKNQISSAKLTERFKFTSLLQPEEIPLAIHASDILVHCSLREGLARVLPQAMLCGKPVVSFDIDGAKEVVNEKTGFLLEPENVDELITACDKLAENPTLREELGKNGKEMVTKMFAPKTMADTIEQVYSNLVNESGEKNE